MLIGQIAHIGGSFQLDVRVLPASGAAPLSVLMLKAVSEASLLDQLSDAAQRLSSDLSRALNRPLAFATSTQHSASARRWAWLPTVVGVVGAAGGVIALLEASDRHQRLLSGQLGAADAATAVSEGKLFQTLEYVGWGLALAGTATAIALYTRPDPPPVRASVTVLPGGAWVGIGGAFP